MMIKPNFMSYLLKGLAIGTAAIIPGISGGTIAFMLGVYDQIIDAIVSIRHHTKKSLEVLLPVGIGIVVAIGLLTYPLGLALTYAPFPTVTLFAGLIIGGLPQLKKDLPKTLNTRAWILLVVPASIAILLGVFSVMGELDATSVLTGDDVLPKLSLLVVGFLGVSAFVVPGISGSMLLLSIGFYEPVLSSLRRLIDRLFDLNGLLPEVINFGLLGVGAVIGFVVISQLMKWLLTNYREDVNLAVFGFILGSLVAIFYNYEMILVYAELNVVMGLLGLVTLTLGGYISWELNKRYATR
jgi:putative membrane protein